MYTTADDYADDTSITGQLTVGGQATGNIELPHDEDWFKISLTTGTTYVFELLGADRGGGTFSLGDDDPLLSLYDASGQMLINSIIGSNYNDPSKVGGFEPLMSYEATTNGTFYLAVSGYADLGTGTYTLKTSAAGVSTDTTAPTVSSFNPLDGATGIAPTANILLKTAAGAIVETFDAATSSHLAISGSTLTIDPTSTLANSTDYYLTFAAGTIKDLAGNAYAGTTAYDFTTAADTTAPTVLITDNQPGTAKLTTGNIAYTLTFSESVTGLAANDITVSNGTVSSISGTGSAWTVNVAPVLGVTSGTIGLTLKAGAVSDASGNLNEISTNTSQAIDTVAPVAPKLVTSSAFNFLIDPQVTLQTSRGTMVFELNPEQAPITVANMLAYVDAGFYDGTLFHRVIPNFMIQGGGFNAGLMYKTPTYSAIKLESNNGLSNLRGTIAMARTSVADSATTQFFVNQVDNTYLNYSSTSSPGYAVFGEVVSGLSVLDNIAQVNTTTIGPYANVPVTDVTITSMQQTLAGSSITNAGTLQVSGLESGAQWSFSLDGGAHWSSGNGNSFTVPIGDYAASAIQVKQTDAAGNTSTNVGKLTSSLVVDMTAPTVLAFSPGDEATGVTVSSNIVVTFSESIQMGTGNIILKTAAGTTVETFDAATSNRLSISGSTLTIDPTSILANSTDYYLTLTAGTIKDLAGNTYTGTTAYDFTTANGQVLNGTAGNDTFNGGDGVDTVVLSGLPSQYTLNGNSLTGLEGLDTVSNIEQYCFGSSLGNPLCAANLNPVSLIDPDGAGPGDSPATDLLQSISDLYVAYFNRAPDITGLMYWFTQISTGSLTLTTTAQSFTDSPEYKATYPAGQSNRDFINTIYLNLFDRAPDAGGWNYWENDLNHGSPRHLFIYTVIQGAYAPTGGAIDKALLNNKHDVSLYYSEQLATHPSEGFDKKIDQVLNRVTADPHTVAQAESVIDYVIANPITLTGVISDTPTWDAFWA